MFVSIDVGTTRHFINIACAFKFIIFVIIILLNINIHIMPENENVCKSTQVYNRMAFTPTRPSFQGYVKMHNHLKITFTDFEYILV